jgi:hypothetical protein
VYDPTDPWKARIATVPQLWGGSFVLGLIGSAFSGVGFAGYLFSWRRSRVVKRLLATGTPLTAEFQEVATLSNPSRVGRKAFQIVVQWMDPESKQIYLFHSDDFSYNPEKYIAQKSFTVYVKPGDLKTYYVDVASLPKLADDT